MRAGATHGGRGVMRRVVTSPGMGRKVAAEAGRGRGSTTRVAKAAIVNITLTLRRQRLRRTRHGAVMPWAEDSRRPRLTKRDLARSCVNVNLFDVLKVF